MLNVNACPPKPSAKEESPGEGGLAEGDWRFRVSAARVFDAGARRTTAGAAVLPKTKMGARLARTLAPPEADCAKVSFVNRNS